MNTHDLRAIAKKSRKTIVDLCYLSQTGHIGPALSVVDILTVLYFGVLRVSPKTKHQPNRDRFILSKGHAASALYATLAARGFISRRTLLTYCRDGGLLGTHPDYNPTFGIELSTGSLGHGLPVGVGMALGLGSRARVFVLVSDAELNEGSVWEATMFAAHHHLDTIAVIVDDNGQQAFGKTRDVLDLGSLEAKWKAFGWEARSVDGHSIPSLVATFRRLPFVRGKPSVVIARTTSGKGVSFMEKKVSWHYFPLDDKLYRSALAQL